MALLQRMELALLTQRGHLFPWVPVCFAMGIGCYFLLKQEPVLACYAWILLLVLPGLWLARRSGGGWGPVVWAVLLFAIGFSVAGLRAHSMAAPVLGWRYYGPVEGRVIGLDRSSSGALRVLMDRVVLRNVAPEQTPERVRVALHGDFNVAAPRAGATMIVTAHLSPPGGPVEPGGFDFQRHAWFLKLGAVGYARSPALELEPPGSGLSLLAVRLTWSARIQSVLEGETGAFAAAIMTGDRAGMSQDTVTALRVSNLAHLLAISGLHMGLLSGFVFAALRLMLSVLPWFGLRLPVKKVAAGLALLVSFGYLGLSGGNIATERAFVMVAVALCAVMVDRRVFSLRAVAVAAVIVLALRPEALMGPGFQMSFAATTALVAVFGWLRDSEIGLGPRWFAPIATVVISSGVAGLVTAPIGAAHFNQIAHYGLFANLLSVPLMGVIVMPAAVLSALLLPFGGDAIGLYIMGLGLDWILGVAHFVSQLEGARGVIKGPDPAVLPLMALGMLLLILWQGRLRFAGVVPVVIGIVLWGMTPRPVILIADGGTLVGVMGQEGRALSRAKGAGFIAANWLENDGDDAIQIEAAKRWDTRWPVGTVALRHVTGKRAISAVSCKVDEVLVANGKLPRNLGCETYDPVTLRETGAVAFYPGAEKGKLRRVTAREITGDRIWNTRPDRRDRRARREKPRSTAISAAVQ